MKSASDDAERRGDEAADVDRSRLAEQDAVRVDQEHLAVGLKAAEDDRRIGARAPG